MDIQVALSRIIINETSDNQIIVLKEVTGERSFPIVIGIVEIFAIDRKLKGLAPPRPMTHDLLNDIIKRLGATIEKVVIDDLNNNTFFAKIYLRSDNKSIIIDSRPSDAIALTAATDVPIFAAEHVLDSASR